MKPRRPSESHWCRPSLRRSVRNTMNQIAFSTVILRLAGFYLIYNLIADLSMGAFIHQAFLMAEGLEEGRSAFVGWIIASFLVKALLGLALVMFAPKISRLLFVEGDNVISAGQINGAALFWVGLSLLGFYFLIRYLPALTQIGIDWFRAEAADTRSPEVSYWPFRGPIEAIVMTILSLFLIFRSKTICSWVTRVSK